MSRIAIPTVDAAPAESRARLDAVQAQLGVTPNLFRLIALSPAALAAYAGFSASLARTLDLKTRERIALAVAQVNGCDYCLSAHSYLGLNLAKLTPAEVRENRKGGSLDDKARAAVEFAKAVVERRGHVAAEALTRVQAAGFSPAQVVEIVALVAENTFTNYLNSVVQTDIDFPIVTADDLG